MLGEATSLSSNLWYVQGEMPSDSSKAPDPCNVVAYKADDRLYLIDSSSGPRMRHSIEGVLREAGPVKSFTLVNTHSHLDHICNNDLIQSVEAGTKSHYLLGSGIAADKLDAPEYFAEQFDRMDQYYDPFTGYQAYKLRYKFAAFLRDAIGALVGRKRVLRFLFKILFRKFKPIRDSRDTMVPLESLPVQDLLVGNERWRGWILGQDDLYVLEGRGHTDDEVFVYIPEHRVLCLGDLTFPLFPTWENSSKERILECLRKSLAMVKAGSVSVLADGHSHRCYTRREDIERLLTETIEDHVRFEEVLRDIFKDGDGYVPAQIYERFVERADDPMVRRYLKLEFPHTPASLQNVMVTSLLQMGYEAKGRYRYKRFYRAHA